jgi:class 3 adenylate cyclase
MSFTFSRLKKDAMDPVEKLKILVIVLFLAFVGILHHIPMAGFFGAHIFHRELFFFPIVLAGLWFGLKTAVLIALAAGAFYAHYFAGRADMHAPSSAVIALQVAGFVLMALLTGWLVDRQRHQQKERDFLNETFGKYVSREVRDEIVAGRIPLKGELKEVTVMFADLRDFTQLVETLSPSEVVKIINLYFEAMAAAIASQKGLVLQFIGDEIEAVFGAPLALDNHQQYALNAALEMRERLVQVNVELSVQGYPPLAHGIGLHTGEVLAGNIGSSQRLSYALVGETVNVASRIQNMNKAMETDILLSDTVQPWIDNKIGMRPQKPVKVKGIREPLQLFSVEALQPSVDVH